MTMDVEMEPSFGDCAQPPTENLVVHSERDIIIDYLASHDSICFKSQQIGESDLNKQDKIGIALEIFQKSKLNFLIRFGKYLQSPHLNYFKQFTTNNSEESYEIDVILKDLINIASNSHQIKNRRYEALKQMVICTSYFSEIEMMKRNPLLYEQLVGQYLTDEEKRERDKPDENTTLVKVLMEGIEREDANLKKKEQKNYEDEVMEEDENSNDSINSASTSYQESYSQWGEFHEDQKIIKISKRKKEAAITAQEQKLLKEEFISFMYQNFLDGKDEDFDYQTVDCDDKYDNIATKQLDDEDKYFDSEEPDDATEGKKEESSEDELDIYMSALNQNPAVCQLSKDLQRL